MVDIKTQKLLYHLTSMENIASIIKSGLLPRDQLDQFEDVADGEILESRGSYNLQNYVPFHFFTKNPFDGVVQKKYKDKKFALITVRRTVAERNGWKIIPRHPLANGNPELLDFKEGIESIDWGLMNQRDYHDDDSKSVCMAECLSNEPVLLNYFFKIYVCCKESQEMIEQVVKTAAVEVDVSVNKNMFVS